MTSLVRLFGSLGFAVRIGRIWGYITAIPIEPIILGSYYLTIW